MFRSVIYRIGMITLCCSVSSRFSCHFQSAMISKTISGAYTGLNRHSVTESPIWNKIEDATRHAARRQSVTQAYNFSLTACAERSDLEVISVCPETRASAFANTSTASSFERSSSAASLKREDRSCDTVSRDLKIRKYAGISHVIQSTINFIGGF